MELELSIPKTQFIVFHRSKNITLPEKIDVVGGHIQRLDYVKYLGLVMDNGLRWMNYIGALKIKTAKYMNVLKMVNW